MNNGYLNEAIGDLLRAEAPAERAVAARTLGIIGSRLATAHLVAALFDSSPEVCRAAAEALARIGDPAVAVAPLNAILAAGPDQKSTPVDDVPAVSEETPVDRALVPESASELLCSLDPQTSIRNQSDVGAEERLLGEQTALRSALENVEDRLLKTEASGAQAKEEVLLAAAGEARFAGRAAALSSEENEFRALSEQAGRDRSQLEASLVVAREVRRETEEKAASLAEEKQRLRAESERLRNAEEQLQQERLDLEARSRQTAAATSRADAELASQAAEQLHQAQRDLLRREEKEHRQATAELAAQRTEVERARLTVAAQTIQLAKEQAQIAIKEEACRMENERIRCAAETRRRAAQEQLRQQKEVLCRELEAMTLDRAEIETAHRAADLEARHLKELLQAAEESSRQFVAERLRLEAEARQRAATEQRLLEDVRHRVQEEQQRLDEVGRRAAEEEHRLAELEASRARMELEARQRSTKEEQLNRELQELGRAETEQRKRIRQTEARLVAAAQPYRVAEGHRVAETKRQKAATGTAEPQIPTNGEAQLARGTEVWLSSQAKALPPAAEHFPVSIGAQGPIPTNGDSAKIAAATARGLNSLDAQIRAEALTELGHSGSSEAFSLILTFFDDVSADVRDAAAWALYELEPHRRVQSFSRAIEESSPERCRSIGRALGASGLAKKAIDDLDGNNPEATYNALCLLFVMAKTGEVQPLVRAVEKHQNVDVRRAAIKLLTLNGHSEIAEAAVKHRLMVAQN